MRAGRRDRPIRTGRRDRPIIQLPSVALRVAIIVGLAVVLFAIILFRLWFLQILSGQQFVAQANDNRLRSVKIVAPRGTIIDRNGEVIVENRPGLAVGMRLMDVPATTRLQTPGKTPRRAYFESRSGRRSRTRGSTGNTATRPFDLVVVKEDADRHVVVLPPRAQAVLPGCRDPEDLPALLPTR